MAKQVVVMHANVHNHESAIKHAVGLGADIFGFNEAHRVIPFLATIRGYRLHTSQPVRKRRDPERPKSARLVSTDTATLVRKKHDYLGEMSQQVSQQIGNVALSGLAPDRWFNVACMDLYGLPTAHLNLHPNAGPKLLHDPDSKHPLVREYAESMDWMDSILDLYIGRGYAVLVTGDLNMRDMRSDPAWSPWTRLRKHGLTYRAHHIDGIAWSKDFSLSPDGMRIIPKAVIGSDHDALRVQLRLA